MLFQLIALLLTMVMAILLGMGMPAVPAYINVALLLGPVLAGLGISIFTANMFIFYFAVASSITPPVALAAFAAASITKAEPMATGFSAVKSGIVIFIVPFIFAMYPEILLISDAVIDPSTSSMAGTQYLQGYSGKLDIPALTWLLARLVLALYLISSALAQYDARPMSLMETCLRLILAVLILVKLPVIYASAIAGALALVLWHYLTNRSHSVA